MARRPRGSQRRGAASRLRPQLLAAVVVLVGFAAACVTAVNLDPNAAAPTSQSSPLGLVADASGYPAEIVGAKVSLSENVLSDEEAIVFDHVQFEHGGELFDSRKPDRLTAPVDGCYEIGAQVTILGDAYGPDSEPAVDGEKNPPNPNWWMLIRRNGVPDDYLAAARENPAERHGVAFDETHTVACLEAGDYIQLFVTPNRLIESNWPGSGGSISPVLYLILIGG